MKKLLEKDIEITAVYAISDVMAIGALRAILDKGLRVPEDILSQALMVRHLQSTTIPRLYLSDSRTRIWRHAAWSFFLT